MIDKKSIYAAGQIWSYKARLNEENSTLTILKVDSREKLGNIVHVAIQGLRVLNKNAPEGITKIIQHAPFSEEAISRSVIAMLQENVPLPDFAEEYEMWCDAFKKGSAGVYSITVGEAIDVMEKTINSVN